MEQVTHKNHLHFYRIQKEKTLANMGVVFKMRPDNFKQMELGRKSPTLEMAWRMADYFGVELHDLFFREGEEPELKIVKYEKVRA